MTPHPEMHCAFHEGVDRPILNQLRGRFLTVNQGRLARAMEGLAPRQQRLLNLLALLFHVNHPLLPGYVSDCTPAGVSGYEPDADTLALAQHLVCNFSYTSCSARPQLIHGLFLMGSLGTLAQTDQSDMDVWLCHGPDLSQVALQALRNKCHRLEQWAASQGCEAHFYLIDAQRFARGEREVQPCSGNGSTTQHNLLLDEFYRTAIWLAGRIPLWWWVPVNAEVRYDEFTRNLLRKGLIGSGEVIDLGHLAHIPPGEFLGAGLWQLFKGIESPYKSVLKLLLIEVYASEHPQVHCLSLRFKQAVYANQLNLDELDPYVVVYRRIERYLIARGDLRRLELVRRSLYLKVNCNLTGSAVPRGVPWQRQLLERLTREWGWGECQLASLDNRSQWKAEEACHERLALAQELSVSYRFLSRFALDEQAGALQRSWGSAAKPSATVVTSGA